MPRPASDLANCMRPVLSETERMAERIGMGAGSLPRGVVGNQSGAIHAVFARAPPSLHRADTLRVPAAVGGAVRPGKRWRWQKGRSIGRAMPVGRSVATLSLVLAAAGSCGGGCSSDARSFAPRSGSEEQPKSGVQELD